MRVQGAIMGGSLTCWCRHLTQQRMKSPRKAREPKAPPSATARNTVWFNPLDETGRRRKKGILIGVIALMAGSLVSAPGTVKKERKTLRASV